MQKSFQRRYMVAFKIEGQCHELVDRVDRLGTQMGEQRLSPSFSENGAEELVGRHLISALAQLSEARVGYLKKGEVVAVTERRGTRLLCNRLRLAGSQSQPFSGWASERALPRDGEEEGTQLGERSLST